MNFTQRPRPTGEAARVVWTLYDLPLNPDAGIGTQGSTTPTMAPTGRSAPPPRSARCRMTAAWASTATSTSPSNNPNRLATIGKVDGKTGEVNISRSTAPDGRAANAHGMTRDAEGNFWFDVNPGRRSLGKLDVKTEKITVYETPNNMSPLGGAVTMDVDGKGNIWASAPDGAVRFDPETENSGLQVDHALTRTPKGTSMTYGAAGDRDGNGWWAQMAMDTIGHGDPRPAKSRSQAAARQGRDGPRSRRRSASSTKTSTSCRSTAPLPGRRARAAWAPTRTPTCSGSAIPGEPAWPGSTPRRCETIDRAVPGQDHAALSHRGRQQPQCVGQPVDLGPDREFDPAANKWTMFDLPVHGTEIRHISLLERDGKMQVVVPVYRSSQMGVMTSAARPNWRR